MSTHLPPELAISIIIALSLDLDPVLKKWLSRAGYLSKSQRNNSSSRRTKHEFRQVNGIIKDATVLNGKFEMPNI